jgi:hypothetical protein
LRQRPARARIDSPTASRTHADIHSDARVRAARAGRAITSG